MKIFLTLAIWVSPFFAYQPIFSQEVAVKLPTDLEFTTESTFVFPTQPPNIFARRSFSKKRNADPFLSPTTIDLAFVPEEIIPNEKFKLLKEASTIRWAQIGYETCGQDKANIVDYCNLKVVFAGTQEETYLFEVFPTIRQAGFVYFSTEPEYWSYKDGVFTIIEPARSWGCAV